MEPADLTLTWSSEATVWMPWGEAVSAFATRAWTVRGEFEGRLVVAILPPNSQAQNLPNDPATRTLLQQRLFEVMDYVAVDQTVSLDFRAGIPTTPIT